MPYSIRSMYVMLCSVMLFVPVDVAVDVHSTVHCMCAVIMPCLRCNDDVGYCRIMLHLLRMYQKRDKIKERTVAFSENGPKLSMAHSDCRGVRNAHAVRGRGTRDKCFPGTLHLNPFSPHPVSQSPKCEHDRDVIPPQEHGEAKKINTNSSPPPQASCPSDSYSEPVGRGWYHP